MSLNHKRTIRLSIILVVIAATLWFGFIVIKMFKQNAAAFNEDLPSTYTITAEDYSLISPKYKKSFKVVEVRRSKVRNNVTILSLANKYILILQRLRLKPGIALPSAIQTKEGNTGRSTMVSYSIIPFDNFSLQYKAGINETTSNLYFTFSGSAIENLKTNDSVVIFSLMAERVSMRYSKKGPVDMYIEGKEYIFIRKSISMDLMVVKRQKDVYLAVLVANTDEPKRKGLIEEVIQP